MAQFNPFVEPVFLRDGQFGSKAVGYFSAMVTGFSIFNIYKALTFLFNAMAHFKTTYKYLAVILAGLIIFLLDYHELANSVTSEIVLFIISIVKAVYFIYFVFRTIKETAHKDFYFNEFMSFVVVSILLVIISFSIDYYCLFRIKADAFTGFISKSSIVTEFITFFYYSISVFTTAGFGDVKPNCTSAQIFVSMELLIAFFFTVLVIANIGRIRSSFVQGKNNNENIIKDS